MREDAIIVIGLIGVATFFVGLLVCVVSAAPYAAAVPAAGAGAWFWAGWVLNSGDDLS